MRTLSSLLFIVGSFGCSDDPAPAAREPTWIQDVSAELPSTLSEVGLFADMPTRAAAGDVIAFEPAHALFSNGLGKERLLHVPEGGAIEPAATWQFPVGTVFAKTFTDGADATPVETRLLFLREDGWDYALYEWAGDDATLHEGNWAEKPLTLDSGVEHTLPARLDCRVCHETTEESFGTPVLGVSALQLTAALAETAPFASPPTATEVTGRTSAETAALGYFVGNCISCHTGGDGTNASFSLYPDDAVDQTVDQPTQSETGEGIRIVPGQPDESVLFITVVEARKPDYTGVFKAMPPIGLSITDPAVEPILKTWIEEL